MLAKHALYQLSYRPNSCGALKYKLGAGICLRPAWLQLFVRWKWFHGLWIDRNLHFVAER